MFFLLFFLLLMNLQHYSHRKLESTLRFAAFIPNHNRQYGAHLNFAPFLIYNLRYKIQTLYWSVFPSSTILLEYSNKWYTLPTVKLIVTFIII